MRSEPIVPLYVLTSLLGIISASLFAAFERQHELSKVESRCLAYFRDTFQGYDTAPEVCEHIVSGKPIAPYQFGQEAAPREEIIRWEDCYPAGQSTPDANCLAAFQKQYDECYLDVEASPGVLKCCKNGFCFPV